jgi:hypothetical protein
LNNPSRFADPSGHRPVEGCGDDGKTACHASDLEKVINAQKLTKLKREANDRKCASGNEAYCVTALKHPIETAAFVTAGLVSGPLVENFVLGGAAAGTADAVLLKATLTCARSLICYRVAVALGILDYYPPNNGFASDPVTTTLQRGQIITRYGPTIGKYASTVGTPFSSRALPIGTDIHTISGFEVIKPIENVLAGPAQGWFGQPGGGIQYYLGVGGRTIQSLIESGHLLELP